MNQRMLEQVNFYVITAIVDANNGSVEFNTNGIKRVFNDENEYVTIEFEDGTTELAYDHLDLLEPLILKYRDENPVEFQKIIG